MGFKKVLTKRTIIWGATSLFLVGLVTTANVLMRNKYNDLLCQVFGGKRAITKETDDTIDFGQQFTSKEDAQNNGNKVTEKICEEGMILLRNENNALPLKNKAKVSIFGKNSVNLVYGGSGSAAPDPDGVRKTIYDSLTDAGFECNPKLKAFYGDNGKSGKGRGDNPAMEHNADDVATLSTGETPQSSYTDEVKNSYSEYGDAALVVISRIAGENWDLPRVAEDNSERHYLELDNNERALLKAIVESGKFQHIVLLLNGSNYIDLGLFNSSNGYDFDTSKIDGCINIGSPGANGIMALGRILNGKVNPSGRTVDLVYTDYKSDPTWQNFGGNFKVNGDAYLNANGSMPDTVYYYVEYEENIYMGYRYYETRGKDDAAWYNQHVVYPFGFGLSYSDFSQEFVNKTDLGAALDANQKFDVEVKVTNNSEAAGKEVVQLYVEAPYESGKIEKPYKILAGFAKTKLLKKGESDTVKITVDPYYFASFDNHDANGDGFKGYTLDAGNYVFHLGKDSHTDIDTFTKNLATTAKFEKARYDGAEDPIDVKPLFDDAASRMTEKLSRTDFEGTMPHTATEAERSTFNEVKADLKSYESGNNDVYTEMPTMGSEDEEVSFRDLVKVPYDDPKWEKFLDSLTFQEYLDVFNRGCYKTTDITRDGKVIVPETTSADGPTGLVSFLGAGSKKTAVYGTCYYCSECLVAQTYNLELAKEEALAIGEEALVGNLRGDGLAYPGWYAPGVNLHRSPFSGRNTEYYSEDPFLCGKFAAEVIKNVQSKGVYANVKHFALNDQETNRSSNGIATWCDEQAIRELYLRSFEIAVKEGKSKGLMTSFNRIGTKWTGGDYRLCTTILRKEWGFCGSVICDFHTGDYMDSKQMLYAGGDINLCGDEGIMLKIGTGKNQVSKTNAKDATLLRNAAHNVLYCVATSNVMKAEVIGYHNPIWQNILTGATIGISVGVVGWGTWAILSSLLKKPKVVSE